jgi:hypothetical protein
LSRRPVIIRKKPAFLPASLLCPHQEMQGSGNSLASLAAIFTGANELLVAEDEAIRAI